MRGTLTILVLMVIVSMSFSESYAATHSFSDIELSYETAFPGMDFAGAIPERFESSVKETKQILIQTSTREGQGATALQASATVDDPAVMFSALKDTPIINVGLRWSVYQSNAAVSYTNSLRVGRLASAIDKSNDAASVVLNVFAAKGDPGLFSKIHFQMDETYNGIIGYHANQSNGNIGEFTFYDAALNVPASLSVGNLNVKKDVVINGNVIVNGTVTSIGEISSKTFAKLDGITVGTGGTQYVTIANESKKTIDFKVGGLIRMRMDPLGFIGIGDFKDSDVPNATLHLRNIAGDASYALHAERGNWRIRSGVELYVDSTVNSLGDRFIIKNNGFIGLGISSPLALLHAAGSVIIDSGNTVTSKGGASLFITNSLKEGYTLNVNNALVVTAAGKTCMGCTSPVTRLEIVGGLRTDTFQSVGDASFNGLSTLATVSVTSTLTATNVIVNSNFSIPGKIETSDDNGKAGGANLHVFGHLLVDRSVIMTGGEGTPPWKLTERLELLEETNSKLQKRIDEFEKMFATLQQQLSRDL